MNSELGRWCPAAAKADAFPVEICEWVGALAPLRDLAASAGLPLLLFDLETTGLSWWSPEFGIVEAAFLAFGSSGPVESAGFLVNPDAPIHWAAGQAHGIADSELAARPTWGEAFASAVSALANSHLWVGFNSAAFDCPAISGQCHRYGAAAVEFPRHLDVRHVKGVAGPLERMCAADATRFRPSHRAASDVAGMAEVLANRVRAHGVDAVLHAMAPVPADPRTTFTTRPLPSSDLDLSALEPPEADLAFERYCFLRRLVRDANAEIEHLEATVLAHVQQLGGKLKNEVGTFTLSERRRWKYSGQVDELSAEVKARKKLEEREGIATPLPPTTFLQVRLREHARSGPKSGRDQGGPS